MTREDKKKIERRAYWHDLLRQLRGTPDFPVKLFFHALFLVGAVYVATKQAILREQVKHIELISPILKAAMEHAVTAYLFVGGLALLTLLLYPFGRRAAKDQLQCIGLINHAGMPPDLLRKRRDKDNPRVTIWEFRNQSIPLQEWEKKCLAIETALGITIVKLAYAKGKSRVLVYAVPAGEDLPEVLKWRDSYLSPKSFVLVLGESYAGPVTVNLAHIPHILLGGSTGSGKSFAAKRELLNVFLAIPQDRIIVVDPMGEYAPLVERLGGQVIEIAPDSPNHISPMDVQMDMGGGDSPLSLKADFLLSLCELVVGGRDGLQPIEKTVIDRCVRQVYREMALGLETAKTPLLQDLYEELLRQPEPEAKRIATALELYCTGSLNLFNHPTNVNLNSRVVCFVLKGMGENLRKIAMHITNDFVTSAVGANFKNGVATWCYFDEFHILLRDPLTASYFVTVWKMLRKQGCVPSALTQNVKDLLASREIENILDNTDFMVLLSQAQSDRAILAKQLGISEHQLSYITHSNSGEGLLFYGNVTIPFVDRFPRGEIYDLLTTRPEDLAHERTDE